MERERVLSLSDDLDLVQLPVLESGSDRLDNLAIPQNLDKGVSFEAWPTESRCMEKVDLVGISSDSVKRIDSLEGSAEPVGTWCRSKEADSVSAVCVWLIVKDRGIERAIAGRSADPVGIGGAEAKVGALVEGFKSAISEEVPSLVSASIGDLEIALAIIGGS